MKIKYKKKPRKSSRYGFVVAGVITALALSLVLIGISIFADKPQPEAVIDPVGQQTADPDSVPEKKEPPVEERPEYYPFVSQELKDAHDENSDVVGWLTVDGCEIDNRIFQYDDNDYYLRKNEQGEYDVWGCYFLDYINIHDDNDLFDRVSIIYGHSLGDTTESEKFSRLKYYRDKSFAKKHRIIRFDMLNEEHEWQVFAVCNIPVSIDYIDPNPDDAKFDSTIGYMLDHSFVDMKTDVTKNDQILVLSTCTSADDVRFVVAAKLVK